MPDDAGLLQRTQVAEAEQLAALLRGHAERLPQPERSDQFGALFDRFGDARVVLLGEATHGTAEFYRSPAPRSRSG
jgi:erythromycin esterase-like protein